MARAAICDHEKVNMKRGLWTAEEDAKILAHVSKHGTGNWTTIPRKAGLRRCGKSCRLRWTNYLRPDLKHDSFTLEEEELIIKLHLAIGSRWSIIAQQLPGRTDNDIKNHWNTKLKKILSERGIDPVTHKPFSQIAIDYGNIPGLPKSNKRIGLLAKDLKNAILLTKSDSYFSSIPRQNFSTINNNNHFNPTPTPTPPQTEKLCMSSSMSHATNTSEGWWAQYSGFYNPLSQPLHIPTAEASFSPRTQIIQPDFLNNNNDINQLNNHNFNPDIGELEAINNDIITKQNIYGEGPSLSSSSSCSSSAAKEKSNFPNGLSWEDFLLDEAFLPVVPPQEEENMFEFLDSGNQMHDASDQALNVHHDQHNRLEAGRDSLVLSSNKNEVSSSGDSTFIEAMLDQDNKMLSDCPHLLEDAFYNY